MINKKTVFLDRTLIKWRFLLSLHFNYFLQPTVYGHLLGYTNNKNMDIQTSSMPISQVFSTMNLTAFNSASLLRAISGTASPTNVGLPSKLTENQYSAPPKLQLIDGNDDTRTQSKEHYVNATPLMQSRRSKSPLVMLIINTLLKIYFWARFY